MRTTISGTAAAVLLVTTGGVLAADLSAPSGAKDAPAYALPWTGFYAGVNVGAGTSTKSFSNGRGGTDYDAPSDGIALGTGDVEGVIGGGQAGYNYQAGKFLFGLEGEVEASGVGGHTSLHYYGATGDLKDSIDWIGTLTARAGVIFQENTLYYIKGGVAWDSSQYGLSALNPYQTAAYPKVSDDRAGWVLGFGAEYLITPRWSAKAEYEYLDFGSRTVAFPEGTGALASAFTTDVDHKLQIVKIGLNYKLGSGSDYVPLK
jgi:outer membrane immunogenic protein